MIIMADGAVEEGAKIGVDTTAGKQLNGCPDDGNIHLGRGIRGNKGAAMMNF